MKKGKLLSPTQQRGHHFEKLALNYLLKRGLEVVEINFSCSCGEIDLILKDSDTLVFTEVRFRKNNSYGGAVASIHLAKQKKIIRTAKFFLLGHGLTEELPCRFDVIGLSLNSAQVEYLWIKNAFQ